MKLCIAGVLAQRRVTQITAMDLSQLNSQSAKVAVFPARVIRPFIETYQWTNRSQQVQEGHIFKCHLVGMSPSNYVEAVWRGKKEDLEKQKNRLTHGSTWNLQKVSLDSKTRIEYVGASVKIVVLLNNSKFEVRTQDDLPRMFQPKYNVSEASMIGTTGVCFDILGLVRHVGPIKDFSNNRQKAVLELMDASTAHGAGKTAVLQVGIWQDAKDMLIEELTKQTGEAVILKIGRAHV